MRHSEIRHLDEMIREVTAADLSEAEVRLGGTAVRIKRERTGLPSVEAVWPAEEAKPAPEAPSVRAHMVGYFHSADPPLRLGDLVEVGSLVGGINALGLDNEVRSKVKGVVREVLVEEGMPVEYGQALYHLEPEGVS